MAVCTSIGYPGFHPIKTYALPPNPLPASNLPDCAGVQDTSDTNKISLFYYMILSKQPVAEKAEGFKKFVCMEVVPFESSTDAQIKEALLERRIIVVRADFKGEITIHETFKNKLSDLFVTSTNKNLKLTAIKCKEGYKDFNLSMFKWVNDDKYAPNALGLLVMKRIVPIPTSFASQTEILKQVLQKHPVDSVKS